MRRGIETIILFNKKEIIKHQIILNKIEKKNIYIGNNTCIYFNRNG